MRIARPPQAIFRAILLILCIPMFLLSADEPTASSTPEENARRATSLLLLSADIDSATIGELRFRAQSLGIDASGDERQLRERLYAYHDITSVSRAQAKPLEQAGDVITITHADRIQVQGSDARMLLLEGQVVLTIRPEGERRQITLSAMRVAVDLNRRVASALGDVRYESDDGTREDLLEGDILTMDWVADRLELAQGGTSLLRENSEGDEVRFHASGSRVTLSPGGRTITFRDGIVTTNPQEAYFSIAASSMHMVDGGDLFVTNARISLGRVPMLWLPFFYYPGRTFVFNPAFGIDTERGWFFSSTTELYGVYPKIERSSGSSFTSLLIPEGAKESFRDGWFYSADEKQVAPLEKWAKSSDSYLALLFDSYRNRGVFLGFDSVNNLFSKRLGLTGFGGVAFPGDGAASLSSVYDIPPIRYGIEGSAQVNSPIANVSLRMAMYSDPRFMRDYGNRLTSFSLGALGGNSSFPQTYRSDIAGFDWLLSARSNIPVKVLSPFLDTLRIERLNARFTWKAMPLSEGSGYKLDSVTLPDLGLYVSGKLLNLTKSAKESERVVTEEPVPLDPAIILEDWGIAAPYAPARSGSLAKAAADSSYLELGYTVRQNYTGSTVQIGSLTERRTSYARTAGSVTFRAGLAPSLLTLVQRLDPLYTVNEGERTTTRQFTLSSVTDVSLNTLGLSYGLSMRLYHRSLTDAPDAPPVVTGGALGWDRQSVSRHTLSWRRPFKLDEMTITPSISTTLDPIPLSLLPKLEFSRGRFTASASYRLAEDAAGVLSGDDAVLQVSYIDRGRIEFSSNATYRKDVARTSGDFLAPLFFGNRLALYPFGTFLSLSESFSYDFDTGRFERFSLSAGIPWVVASIHGSGTFADPVIDLLDTTVRVDALRHRWWKNRISFALDLDVSYRHSFWDTAASAFTFKITSSFSIAEFLSLDVALTTVNRGFHRYGSFGDLWDDLVRSFDFIGDGRKTTQFTMETVEISLVHHMADWDLHCKYQGSVVLSDLEWRWTPVFTVFLQWKAIPEIKVDRRFDVGR